MSTAARPVSAAAKPALAARSAASSSSSSSPAATLSAPKKRQLAPAAPAAVSGLRLSRSVERDGESERERAASRERHREETRTQREQQGSASAAPTLFVMNKGAAQKKPPPAFATSKASPTAAVSEILDESPTLVSSRPASAAAKPASQPTAKDKPLKRPASATAPTPTAKPAAKVSSSKQKAAAPVAAAGAALPIKSKKDAWTLSDVAFKDYVFHLAARRVALFRVKQKAEAAGVDMTEEEAMRAAAASIPRVPVCLDVRTVNTLSDAAAALVALAVKEHENLIVKMHDVGIGSGKRGDSESIKDAKLDLHTSQSVVRLAIKRDRKLEAGIEALSARACARYKATAARAAAPASKKPKAKAAAAAASKKPKAKKAAELVSGDES